MTATNIPVSTSVYVLYYLLWSLDECFYFQTALVAEEVEVEAEEVEETTEEVVVVEDLAEIEGGVAGMVAVEEEGTSVVSIPIDLKSIDRWD
jgi:hypothetical protein